MRQNKVQERFPEPHRVESALVHRQGTWIVNIETRSMDQGSSARHLAAAAEPVFIFDGKVPVLVWANAAALAFVRHAERRDHGDRPATDIAVASPAQHLPQLDRSMPAMTRLRALAEQDFPAHGTKIDLVFWTGAGARTLTCVCRRASFAFAQEGLIVHAVMDGGGEPQQVQPESGKRTGTPTKEARGSKTSPLVAGALKPAVATTGR
jgi:hypothetical protein